MSNRIKTISEYTIGNSVIDIGTDHGYLLKELIAKKFDKLCAIEKNQGPLQNCKDNLKKYEKESNINYRLSDGLQELTKEEIKPYENIVISGMGGILIKNILKQDLVKFRYANLIFQPNNKEKELRIFLLENKFEIIDENIIEEKNKIYEIIVAKYNPQMTNNFLKNHLYLNFGLKEKWHKQEFIKKWNNELIYWEKLRKNIIMEKKKIPKDIEEKINLIKKLKENL